MKWWHRKEEVESDALEETQVWRPTEDEEYEEARSEDPFPTRSQRHQAEHQIDDWDEEVVYEETTDSHEDTEQTPIQRRAKYHARMDRFLTNGIIIVGVLLICVLLIAFLV